ncbi:MAG: tagaturonate reductase [Lachnospiraceae bacterium]
MKHLNYETLEEIGYQGYLIKEAPERVLQFGEGNFMRAFVDYFFDIMNEKTDFSSKVVLVQPIKPGLKDFINQQDGLYTLYLRGFQNGQKVNQKRIISCVCRCLNPYDEYEAVLKCAQNPELRFITCNTTEAGITYDPSCNFADTPASSFPGKLTQFLYRRFETFKGAGDKGLIILACELIDNNGKELKNCVLKHVRQWELGDAFTDWLDHANIFCSTLVDRIVTGYPRNEIEQLNEENGYIDNLIDTGEIFGFWVIEGPDSLVKELPFKAAGLPVLITADHTPYKQRKVRILNGAHTAFVLGAYLSGQDIVRNCMDDQIISGYMNKTIYQEIIPTLTLPHGELDDFAASVTERFKNPFIDHALLDISLNSTSKWKARVLPSLKRYAEKYGTLPKCITASFAFYIAFYQGFKKEDQAMVARRHGNEYLVKDDAAVIDFYLNHQDDDTPTLVRAVCRNINFWGEDLTEIPQFEEKVCAFVNAIKENGAYNVMKGCLED